MEIHHGSARTAIILGQLVLKFPSVFTWPKLVVSFLSNLRKGTPWKSRFDFRWCWEQFKRAVHQNRTEYQCWKKARASYLVPVHFSIGILNVTAVCRGEIPLIKEWFAVLWTLPKEAQAYLWSVDPHSFHPHNIRKTSDGYVFIDYGHSGDDGGNSICHFLVTWKSALEERLRTVDISNTS